MFNDNGSPISLFSFQDIITSLTGIMIFFLLLLSLNILEISSQQTELSTAKKELDLIKQQNAIQQKHIQEISNDINSYRKRIRFASAKDESMLVIEQFNLQEQLHEQKKLYKKSKQNLDRDKENLKQAEVRLQELSEELKKIEEQLAANHTLSQQNNERRSQIEKIRNAIKKKRKSVTITIDSSIDKNPILIECSASRMCVYDKNSGLKKVFIRRTPMIAPLIDNVIDTLRSFSIKKYYFVFLFKPSAANYAEYLRSRFLSEIKNADYGCEPVYETEGIDHE